MRTARRALGNSAWLASADVATQIMGFASAILMARLLGSQVMGQYAFCFALTGVVNPVVDLGLGTVTVRALARDASRIPYYFSNVLSFKVIQGVLGYGAILIVSLFLHKERVVIQAVRVAGAAILINAVIETCFSIFSGREELRQVALLGLLGNFARQVTTLWLIFARQGLLALVLATLACRALTLLVTVCVFRSRFGRVGFRPDIRSWPSLIKESWAFGATAVFSKWWDSVPVVVLGWLSSDSQVGYFAAARKLIDVGRVISRAYSPAVFPVLSRLAIHQSKNRFDEAVRLILRALMAVGVLACVLAVVGAPDAIRLAYGAKFVACVPVLRLLGAHLGVAFLTGFIGTVAYATNREVLCLRVNAGLLALEFGLDLWLVPAFGAVGAAVARLGCETLAVVVYGIFLRVALRPASVALPAVLTVVSGALLGAMWWGAAMVPVLVKAALAVPLFAGLLFGVRAVRCSDLERVRVLFRPRADAIPPGQVLDRGTNGLSVGQSSPAD